MGRYTGPKLRKARRVGIDLDSKQNAQKTAKRLNIIPGQHGQRFRRGKRASEYGVQLLEKQKIRFMYGVSERQLRRYVVIAQKNPQATGEELLKILERRLDNVLFRLGLAPTRDMSRQLIVHGHILVNNQKIDRPSYQVSIGDIIILSKTAQEIPDIARCIANKEHKSPSWMQKKTIAGKISRLPTRKDTDDQIEEQLIVEYYSR